MRKTIKCTNILLVVLASYSFTGNTAILDLGTEQKTSTEFCSYSQLSTERAAKSSESYVIEPSWFEQLLGYLGIMQTPLKEGAIRL